MTIHSFSKRESRHVEDLKIVKSASKDSEKIRLANKFWACRGKLFFVATGVLFYGFVEEPLVLPLVLVLALLPLLLTRLVSDW